MRISDENIAIVPKEAVSVPRARIPIQTVGSVTSTADAVFGPSHAMQKVLEQVTRAAATHGHVLICGEPGTGREMVAREIHRLSPQSRRGGFVKVGYTSSSAEAPELDLFGFHSNERSAHFGSADHHVGHDHRTLERIASGGQLHQALGGTLFLEHLPDIPSGIQARLARLLRDGEAIVIRGAGALGSGARRGLGAPGLINAKFDTRAIVAIEHSYDEALREGLVRSDLHRVISAMRIELPPLRNRREDIPALTTFFLGEICRELKVPVKTTTDSAQQLLSALPWHGNAWELKSLLDGVIRRARGDVIELRDVLEAVQLDGRAKPYQNGGTLREVRTQFERDYIVTVLDQHHGRIPDAAKTLGIERTNLYRKLRRLKVPKRNGRNRTA